MKTLDDFSRACSVAGDEVRLTWQALGEADSEPARARAEEAYNRALSAQAEAVRAYNRQALPTGRG